MRHYAKCYPHSQRKDQTNVFVEHQHTQGMLLALGRHQTGSRWKLLSKNYSLVGNQRRNDSVHSQRVSQMLPHGNANMTGVKVETWSSEGKEDTGRVLTQGSLLREVIF